MRRDVLLFTGQWADLPFAEVARRASEWGYDGLEVACWGDHLDVERAAVDDDYVSAWWDVLRKYDLKAPAISNHLVGQAISDRYIDERHRSMLPEAVWGDGDPDGIRARATDHMKTAARAAARLGVPTVVGFTGSPTWHMIAGWPPINADMVEEGYQQFARQWHPIIDVFEDNNVRFALEVHPSEIAFDYWSTQRTLEVMDRRPGFGLNFDPGHLHWQFIDLVGFIREFGDRIYHSHAKECTRHLDGRNGVISGLLDFGDLRRGWDFAAVGHGEVSWEQIIRAMNAVGYDGPISVEWDDAHISREQAAQEAVGYLRRLSMDRAGGDFQSVFK